MAKSKTFFGLRRGSTKTHTYSILNGQQITKDRVESVANPQTNLQMVQRVVFATVTQAADKMLPIIGISQQGVTNETESRRRWISQNVKALRQSALKMRAGGAVEAAFAPKGNLQLIPNSYQMSRGGLSIADALIPKTGGDNGKSFGSKYFAPVNKTAQLVIGQTYTGLELWQLLLGVQPGDQLTFPQIYGEGEAQALFDASGNYLDVTRFTDFCAPRIVFKSSVPDEDALTFTAETTLSEIQELMLTAVDEGNTWYDMENWLEHIDLISGNTLDIDEDYDTLFAINNDDPLRAIGCIRSHKDENGNWLYSTSYLVCVWADESRSSDSAYFGFTLNNAIETYLNNVTTDADGNFLQRGTDSNIVPESFM